MNATGLMLAIAGAALLSGCGGRAEMAAPAAPTASPSWRTIATAADRTRLRNWRETWMQALAKARAGGKGAQIAAQGVLLQPDAALADPAPAPGDYRCRVIKVGAQAPGGLDYVAYPPFRCRVAMEGDILSLTKVDGSQRPVGLLFPADSQRMIFLGTMMLGDERMALDYGRDPERDMAGALERVGPQRWRLVLPRPRWESLLDVVELVPA
ncbi:DUF4893 domain-containing protein [Sphingomonas sp. 1P06PA]|uniref:DUF4893 domain-containing protein n=1 Tax=Sphingomonas sp. 1P06PA TaxID=554121 RepID=UPI0039A656EB